MIVRLIATDMDGTFLDGQGNFDRERFSRVLDQLDQKKIPLLSLVVMELGDYYNYAKDLKTD